MSRHHPSRDRYRAPKAEPSNTPPSVAEKRRRIAATKADQAAGEYVRWLRKQRGGSTGLETSRAGDRDRYD